MASSKEQVSQKRVRNGLTMLKKHGFDLSSIDISVLDMEENTRCPLGQLTGSFNKGDQELKRKDSDYYSVFCGFFPDDIWTTYDSLKKAWKEELSQLPR